MEHGANLGAGPDENPRAPDGEHVAHREGGDELVGDDEDEGEEGDGDGEEDDARGEGHGEEGDALDEREVEERVELLRDGLLGGRLAGGLEVVGGRLVAEEAAEVGRRARCLGAQALHAD